MSVSVSKNDIDRSLDQTPTEWKSHRAGPEMQVFFYFQKRSLQFSCKNCLFASNFGENQCVTERRKRLWKSTEKQKKANQVFILRYGSTALSKSAIIWWFPILLPFDLKQIYMNASVKLKDLNTVFQNVYTKHYATQRQWGFHYNSNRCHNFFWISSVNYVWIIKRIKPILRLRRLTRAMMFY